MCIIIRDFAFRPYHVKWFSAPHITSSNIDNLTRNLTPATWAAAIYYVSIFCDIQAREFPYLAVEWYTKDWNFNRLIKKSLLVCYVCFLDNIDISSINLFKNIKKYIVSWIPWNISLEISAQIYSHRHIYSEEKFPSGKKHQKEKFMLKISTQIFPTRKNPHWNYLNKILARPLSLRSCCPLCVLAVSLASLVKRA